MRFPFSRLKVEGQSMVPTFSPGQFLVSFNWFLNPKVGNIVVVKYQDKLMVKRIQKMKADEIFVVGDNLSQSTDSRQFGWVKKKQIIGKVIFKLDNRK